MRRKRKRTPIAVEDRAKTPLSVRLDDAMTRLEMLDANSHLKVIELAEAYVSALGPLEPRAEFDARLATLTSTPSRPLRNPSRGSTP